MSNSNILMNFFSNNLKKTTITENHVFLSLIFIIFGFYGAGTSDGSSTKLLHFFSPILIFILFLKTNKEDEILFKLNFFEHELSSKKNFFILISLFTIFFFLSSERILMSIADDEYAYTSVGLSHSILLTSKIAERYDLFDNVKVSTLIQLISLSCLLFLLFISIFIIFFLKQKKFIKICLIFLILFFFRTIIFNLGGNNFAHPPLLGISPFIFTSIIGLSDLNLKISYFLLYVLFSFYFYIKLSNKISSLSAFLISLVLFSTPGLLYLGTSLEQALLSTICFSIILIELNDNKNVNYKKLVIIILIFSFMRVLSLLSVSAIIIYILINSKSVKNFVNELINLLKNLYPLIILVPFLFYTFIDNSNITVDRVGFQLIEYFNTLKELPFLILNSLTIQVGILTILFLMIALFYSKKSFSLILFTLVLVTIYSKVLNENTKYIYEIFFPFLLTFTYIVASNFRNNFYKKMFIFLLLCIFPLNILTLKKFSSYCLNSENPFKQNLTYKVNYGCNIIDAKPFNLKKSFNYLKKQKDFEFKNLYVPGVYYGLLPSIINGMKMKDLSQHRSINQKQNRLNQENNIEWISSDARLINKDERIKYVLIADTKNFLTLQNDLIANGWNEINIIKDTFYKTNISILEKNNIK